MKNFLVLLLTFAALSGSAHAASVQFEQGGWSGGGGPLLVSFAGQDNDADGFLALAELTSFNASWRTSLGIETAWLLADIEPDGFLFQNLDNYLFFTRNSEFSLVSTAFEGEALASVFDSLLFPVDSTSTAPSAIPEPASLSLMGLAALSFAALARRRHARQNQLQ
ncbi:MAG: PEP-CTERM sorting domain-containing protein [Bryobacteraceae bacterium]|nr:PEP-CTERM sorting domain-containing protein [Bryobacteraceae bacterium]